MTQHEHEYRLQREHDAFVGVLVAIFVVYVGLIVGGALLAIGP